MNDASARLPHDIELDDDARSFSLKDQVVIISGAAQGIGREVARQFAAAAAVPIIVDINLDKAKSVEAEIVAAGGRALALRADIADQSSLAQMVDAVMARFGKIDCLINNGAIFASLGKRPFDEIPLQEWEQVLKVNITGTYLSVCAVLPAMKAAGRGRIINISSAAVALGAPQYLHYVASKSAIIGMTNAMAREVGGYGINVNAIRPGAVATEVDRTVNPTVQGRALWAERQCVPRGQVPADMVGLMMFLASPASRFISGQTIACDGGLTHSF